jgi:hypothetical protein
MLGWLTRGGKMERLDYDRDIREPADNRRLQNFREGWHRGADKDNRLRTPAVLDELTWENLGYRLGTLLKDAPDKFIDVMYAMCAMLQHDQQVRK